MTLEFVIHVSIAGFLATYFHLVLAAWGDKMGMARIDFSRGMTNVTFGESYEGEAPLSLGLAQIHLNGILFALLYASVVAKYIPVENLVLKGFIFGEILWVISGLFFIPVILQGGLFGTKHHPKAWMTTAFGHGAWGVTLGWLAPVL
jgi:hypothetical protein